ncbi:hypothetical protein ATANTOWER_032658 [Ataeniobius toweri]|uniref:Uncharacterized protein n=1 Tax=Ataeniobius toweri TaxID=208326 RepID=A0ABU7CJ52_9TELE|nr:hypothetical protein [Ataeniobius toweri]
MDIHFTKKAFPDSFEILLRSFMTSEGNLLSKLTAATMAATQTAAKYLMLLQIYFSQEKKVRFHQIADHQMLWRADGHLIHQSLLLLDAGVKMHEPYRATRKQNQHNILILKIIH